MTLAHVVLLVVVVALFTAIYLRERDPNRDARNLEEDLGR